MSYGPCGPAPGHRPAGGGAPRPGGAAAGPAAGRLSAPAPAVGDRPAAAGHHDRAVCRLPAPGGGGRSHGGGGAAEEPGPSSRSGRSCWPAWIWRRTPWMTSPPAPCAGTRAGGALRCAAACGRCAPRSRSGSCPSCWTWGSSPSTPSGWTITAPASGPNGAPPPGRTWSWCTRCVSTMPRTFGRFYFKKPLPQRGPRAGQDLPVCLHRPHCVGERTFGGV
mgnify:CR=1 FL=1